MADRPAYAEAVGCIDTLFGAVVDVETTRGRLMYEHVAHHLADEMVNYGLDPADPVHRRATFLGITAAIRLMSEVRVPQHFAADVIASAHILTHPPALSEVN